MRTLYSSSASLAISALVASCGSSPSSCTQHAQVKTADQGKQGTQYVQGQVHKFNTASLAVRARGHLHQGQGLPLAWLPHT